MFRTGGERICVSVGENHQITATNTIAINHITLVKNPSSFFKERRKQAQNPASAIAKITFKVATPLEEDGTSLLTAEEDELTLP